MRQPHLVLCRAAAEPSSLADDVWSTILVEAGSAVERERILAGPIGSAVLRHNCFAEALVRRLARKLESVELDATALADLINDALTIDPGLVEAAAVDLMAIRDRDPACPDLLTPFLYFKGFQALQAWRVSHFLWLAGRTHLARHLQARISEVFAIDIHPAARLGRGIMLDHGTGIIIGETAVVEDDVSILQEVTLGGTGKAGGDRHPKIRRGVLIGAGAKILGNIEVGEGAKVGAGSIVLEAVEPFTTVVGVPARPVGARHTSLPALTMDHALSEQPEYAI
jgi:serine O-acetyltransferase